MWAKIRLGGLKMAEWNSLKEKGLPPIGRPLIVTIKNNLQSKPNELRYPVYYEKDNMKDNYRWSWRYGDFAYELLSEVSEVIAWQLLPELYKEEDLKCQNTH